MHVHMHVISPAHVHTMHAHSGSYLARLVHFPSSSYLSIMAAEPARVSASGPVTEETLGDVEQVSWPQTEESLVQVDEAGDFLVESNSADQFTAVYTTGITAVPAEVST